MAFALGIRYLTGRAVATAANDYGEVEWPPHPARVFMALAAAHFEDPPADEQDVRAEADALRWLEGLDPPEIIAADADERSVVTHYVPPNDVEAPRGNPVKLKPDAIRNGLQVIPALRTSKQPRTFPSVRLASETAYLHWPNDEPNGHASALECICRRVTRVGHSSSLVQMWVAHRPPDDVHAWRPDGQRGTQSLRVSCRGLFDSLAEDYASGNRPVIGLWHGYRRDGEEAAVPGTVWSDALIVLRLSPLESRHRRLDLCTTLALTQRLHESVQMAAEAAGLDAIPEWLSGHKPDGGPSESPHVAFFPLAFVGREHADGHLLGIGVALPENGLDAQQRRLALRVLGHIRELRLGRLGRWALEADDRGKSNLRPDAWTSAPRGATRWATVTPIVFDQHPKAKDRVEYEREAVAIVRQSCERIGLPEPPREVILTPVSAHLGAPASHEFPRIRRKDGSERRHRHAILIFDEPVRGPIAIGAGRYRGYGFCRPLREEGRW